MKLLLDTSTFLWFITADNKLSDAAAGAIRSSEHDVYLSAVSFWEILVKHQLGRLPLPESPASYVPKQRKRHGVSSLALREKAMKHLPKLPPLHKDPFDRMLVCQSLEHGLTVVTSDPLVRAYPIRTLW